MYVELHEGVNPQALADSLLSLDNLLLVDANTQVVVPAASAQKVVEPPLLILVCPPTLLIQYALEQVGALTSIRRHQMLDRPGHALITLEHGDAAKVLAGCRIPSAGAGTITLTSGCPAKDASANSEMGVPVDAPVGSRAPHLLSLGRSVLSIENVAAAAIHDHGIDAQPPIPSDCMSENEVGGGPPSLPL